MLHHVFNLDLSFVHLVMDQEHVQEIQEDPYFYVKMEGELSACIGILGGWGEGGKGVGWQCLKNAPRTSMCVCINDFCWNHCPSTVQSWRIEIIFETITYLT